MTDGFKENIRAKSGKTGVICVAQSRMRTGKGGWKGRIYRTYRVRRVCGKTLRVICGKTGGELAAVQEETRHAKRGRTANDIPWDAITV